MKRCPQCGAPTMGAFYLGLPGWICMEHEPSDGPIAGGLGPNLPFLIGFHGALVVYRRGDYWRTLWAWITGTLDPRTRKGH